MGSIKKRDKVITYIPKQYSSLPPGFEGSFIRQAPEDKVIQEPSEALMAWLNEQFKITELIFEDEQLHLELMQLPECNAEPMVDVTITFNPSDQPLTEAEMIAKVIQMLRDSGFEVEYNGQ